MTRDCPYCEGKGCSECDGTGQNVTTALDLGGDASMVVHGSVPLTPEAAEALREIGEAAIRQMNAERPDPTPGLRGLTQCPRCGEEF